MLQDNLITKIIDIQDAIVEDIQEDAKHITIFLCMQRKAVVCPCCHSVTDKVHDYRTQRVKDIAIRGKPVILTYRKRRYKCTCCNKRFYEKLPILPKYHRITNRLAFHALSQLSDRVSVKNVAINNSVSPSSVFRWLKLVKYPTPKKLPKVLSIDEFRGNSGGEKFNCVITDLKESSVFDILKSRKQEDILSYLSSFKDRSNVKYVVMDMNRVYRDAVRMCMPKATIVIDRFHVARYNSWAFENVRKRVQKKLYAYDRKYFKKSRRLLLSRMKALNDEEKLMVERMLSYSTDLTNAYILKEYFYDFMSSKSSREAKERLAWLRRQMSVINLKEYENVFTMLRNWESYILNSFDVSYSNGFTEGINNSIKVIKRVGFGYRNFDNFRKRILMIHKKQFGTGA